MLTQGVQCGGAAYQVAQGLGHFQGSQAPHAQLALVGQEALVPVHQHCTYGIGPIHQPPHLYRPNMATSHRGDRLLWQCINLGLTQVIRQTALEVSEQAW